MDFKLFTAVLDSYDSLDDNGRDRAFDSKEKVIQAIQESQRVSAKLRREASVFIEMCETTYKGK